MSIDRAARTTRLVGTIERLQGLSTQVRVPAFVSLDVTMPQAKALHLIWRQPGIRMSALATGLGVGQSTVSGSVDRLVEMGLVARREDPADRRQVILVLTGPGHATVDRIHDLSAPVLEDLLASLTDGELVGLELGVDGLIRALEARAQLAPHADAASSSQPIQPGSAAD